MKRLQNRIAESRFALPVTAVYALATWLMSCATGCREYIELAMFSVSTYLMVELNNRNALIRVYSRMVSCAFLVLGTMAAPAIGSINVLAVQLCFIVAYLLLFSCYQDKRAQGRMFYAFACIGIANIIFPQALFFVPVMWILTGTNLMAFSGRNFWASIIGLTAPYWFLAGYYAITGDFNNITSHLNVPIWNVSLEQAARLLEPEVAVPLGFILLMAVIGTIHFLRNSYMDKIRTRMIYEFVIVMTAFTTVFIALQPQYAEILTGILMINSVVLAAHFIALTHTKVTNIAFCVLALAALAATAFNFICNYAPQANNLSPWSL